MSSKAVLITGAAKRLGAEIARALAADGWDVCIHYNGSAEEAKKLCKEIDSISIRANLTDKKALASLINDAATALGKPITALINNAVSYTHLTLPTILLV